GRQGNAALTGEVPQVEKLGRPGAGGDQSVHARVDAAVEDPDQDAAPVVGRVFATELIHARAVQRHQARQQRARRREDWGAAPCSPPSSPSRPAAVGLSGGCGRRRGGGGSRGRSRGGAAAGGERGEGAEGGRDGREGAQPHVRPVRAKGPMCGPVNSEVTSSRNASTSRVSSGAMIASTYPLAPANLASSCRS